MKIMKAISDFKKGFTANFKKETSKIGFIVGYIQYNGDNLPIIYNPAHVDVNDSIFAVCAEDNGKYRIVVDNYYMTAPKYVKEFINYHELGHLYWLDNGHKNEHTLKDEIIADAYSAERVGNINAINSLNYVWTVAGNTGNTIRCLTFPSRLKDLGADVSSMYIIGLNGKTFHEADLRKILEGGDLNEN